MNKWNFMHAGKLKALFKRSLSMILIFALVFELLPMGIGSSISRASATVTPDYTWYGDGSGTTYTIDTAGELLGLANLVNGTDGKSQTSFSGKTVSLTANIDLANVNWLPIGDNRTSVGPSPSGGPRFQGTFDGDDFIISNLNVNITGGSDNVTVYGGLFGVAGSSSTIRDVRLLDPSVYVVGGLATGISTAEGGAYAGGIVGLAENIVENCHVINGSVTVACNDGGSSDVGSGGIAGRITGTVRLSSSSASVYAASMNISSGTYATQSKIPPSLVGGVVGDNRGTVQNCSSSGTVNNGIPRGTAWPKPYTGGIAGLSNTSNISNCLFTGTVTGTTSMGAIGIGGIIGGSEFSNTVTNCYYSSDTVTGTTHSGGTGLSTAQLLVEGNFSGWDFTNNWIMGSAYPVLKGFKEATVEVPCLCELGTFTVAGSDSLVIPYGGANVKFTLAPTAPTITHSSCTVPGHNVDRAATYTYIVKSAAAPDATPGMVVDGASIDPATKELTFTKAGSYTVDVYAGDALSLKMTKATAAFTVTDEDCTCVIPDFSLANSDLLIPYGSTSAVKTFTAPTISLGGDCQVTGHSAKSIVYTYSVVSKDSTVTSAEFSGNQLTAVGEGLVNIRLTATVPNTDAVPVIKDVTVHVSHEICNCAISEFSFVGGTLVIPLAESSIQKTFVDPSLTYTACGITGHNGKAVNIAYSIVPGVNTAGATISGNTLTANQSGTVTVQIKASVAGTDAVTTKTATFTVVNEQFSMPDHLKTIEILAGNSATIGWDSNYTGSVTVRVKNSGNAVVKTETVSMLDRKYVIPASVLTGLDAYTVELSAVGRAKVLTSTVTIVPPQTRILFDPAETVYYDNVSSHSFAWKTTNELAGTSKAVTVKKNGATFSNFSVSGNIVTINGIGAPADAKDTYNVAVAASYGGKVIASDSISFAVYKTNALQVVSDTGVSYNVLEPLLISNQAAAAGMSQAQLLANANSFNLQRTVKLAQPYSAYGVDTYRWTIQDPSVVSFGSGAVSGGTYASNALMTLIGLKDGQTTITVTHVATNATTTFKVNVQTLSGKLYLMKLPVAAALTLQYTSNGQTKTLTTDGNGMAAVYEATGITGTISAYGESGGKVYMGQTDATKFASGELTAANAKYPVNKVNAVAATNIALKFSASKSGKLVKDSKVKISGYLLKNNQVVGTQTETVTISRTDYQKFTLNFDTTPLLGLSATDQVKFVYEVTGVTAKTYSPAYASVEPTSGGSSFDEVSVKLQPWQETQEAYINSIWQSTSLTGAWENISTKTDSLNLDEKTTRKYIKTLVCWPKNKIGTANLVNAKGNAIGASSVTTTDKTLSNMQYSWQEVVIKVDSTLIPKGEGLKFSYSLYTTTSKSIQIPSGFVLANVTGVKSFDMTSGIPFLGIVGTGDTGMKVIGNRGVSIPLPSDLGATFQYQFDEDPLNGTFQVIFGKEAGNVTSKEKDPEFKENFEKAVKDLKDKSKVKSAEKGVNVKLGGYMMGDIKYRDGKWTMVITGGGIYGGVEGYYSFSQTQFLGPVPICYGVEFKVGAELTVGIDSARVQGSITWSNFGQTMDIYLKIYASVSAYGGVGFDYGWVAARVGLFGQLGLEYYFRSSFIESARRNGGQMVISGTIGLEAVFKFLFYKKRYVLCEAGFEKKFKPNGFDFEDYGGFKSPIALKLEEDGMTFVEQVAGMDGKLYDLYESSYTVDDRAYLATAQAWMDIHEPNNSVASVTYDLLTANAETPVTLGSNQYPYGYPMLSSDGNMMALLSDFGSTNVNDTGAAYSVKTGNAWSTPSRIYVQGTNTPASSMSFEGTASFAGAAWESMEGTTTTSGEAVSVSSVDISTSLSQSEIYVALYNGSAWTTQQLTDNSSADMAPAVAVNNGHAIVVWQRVDPSADDPMNVVTKNELWFSTWNGSTWSAEKRLDSGEAGNIKSFNVAIAEDGTARVVANVDTDRDDSTVVDRDVFSYQIAADQTFARQNLTNNAWQDSSAKVTFRKVTVAGVEKSYFLTAWYSEQTDTDGALLNRDIKLRAETTDGVVSDSFPVSIGGGSGTGNFSFIKSTETSANTVGIVWTETTGDSDKAYQTLYARLLTTDESTGLVVTPAYELTSVNPDDKEIAKFATTAKLVSGVVNINTVYLNNNLALVTEDGSDVSVIKAISADLMQVNRQIKDAAEISAVDYDEAAIVPSATVPMTVSVFNSGFSKIYSLSINANGQTITKEVSIMPNETKAVSFDYVIDANMTDLVLSVVPTYANAVIGTAITKTLALSKPDINIKNVVLSGTGDGGERLVDVNLQNLGVKALSGSGNRVQVLIFDDFARKVRVPVQDLATGQASLSGELIISDPEKLAEIDNGEGTCKFGYTVLAADYDNKGNKTLYMDVNVIDANGNIVDEATYSGNQGGITFTSPKLLYPTQFEVTVVQGTENGVTTADIEVRNLYPEASNDTLKLRLMNENQVIEEKSIPVQLGAETSVKQRIVFAKFGSKLSAAFLSDIQASPVLSPKEEKMTTPAVVAPVTTPVIPRVETGKITAKTMDAKGSVMLSEAELKQIEVLVVNGPIRVTFDKKAVSSLLAKGDITVQVKPVDKSQLVPAAQKMIGERPIYAITVESKLGNVTSFNNGMINVGIPYTLQAGEDEKAILVYYVGPNGSLKPVYSSYDTKTNTMNFMTNHLSTYGVGYNKVNFTDVSGWATPYITYLAAHHIVNGSGDGKFAPNAKVTRAEFLSMLYQVVGEVQKPNAANSSVYTDVKASDWYAPYVAWATENGIASGTGKNQFSPNATISKEQMATMLYKFMGHYALSLEATQTPAAFKDQAQISKWSAEAISYLQSVGVVSGSPNGNFSPKESSKRSEAAAMIAGFMERIAK